MGRFSLRCWRGRLRGHGALDFARGLQGQGDRKTAALAQARAVAAHFAAVQLHQAFDQGQAQSQAALGTVGAAFGLGEQVEHARLHVGLDADAVVLHGQRDAAMFDLAAQAHVAAGLGVFGGVSDQSRLRINCPISLLPSRKLVVAVWTGVAGMAVGVAAFALHGTRGKKDRRRPVFPVGIACQYCLTSPRPMISGKVQSCACRAAAVSCAPIMAARLAAVMPRLSTAAGLAPWASSSSSTSVRLNMAAIIRGVLPSGLLPSTAAPWASSIAAISR